MTGWLGRGSAPNDPALVEQLTRLSEQVMVLTQTVSTLEKHVERLGKEQLRTNTLSQAALDRAALAERSRQAAKLPSAASEHQLALLEALMPLLDGIEAGLQLGRPQLDQIVDPAARAILDGWLEGQRLLRERLLAIFEREGVRIIQTQGQTFDPFKHVAATTVFDPARPVGTILEERRRGFELNGHVLRYAEVVVSTDQPR